MSDLIDGSEYLYEQEINELKSTIDRDNEIFTIFTPPISLRVWDRRHKYWLDGNEISKMLGDTIVFEPDNTRYIIFEMQKN